MEFTFTEEQQMIRESAESFLADVSTSESIRQVMATEQGYDADIWQRVCSELYLQAITIPEDFGGLGLGFVELAAVMEQMGRYLFCSPFFSTVCLAATALRVAGKPAQQADLFGKMLEGQTASVAFNSNSRFDSKTIEVTYRKDGDNYVLNGNYCHVLDGHTAQHLILVAREEGTRGHEGIGFFLVEASTPGLTATYVPTMDQTRKQATVRVENVTLNASQCMATDAVDQFHTFLDLATITLAAEQMGGAQKTLDLSVEYTKERVQFNRPVASFQAVKHKAADMMMRVEAARSGVYYAACVADEALTSGPLANELSEAAGIVKAYCSEAFFKNAGDAIQLFGGVGFTFEYDPHLYFKRAKASEHFLGNASIHRERVARKLFAQ